MKNSIQRYLAENVRYLVLYALMPLSEIKSIFYYSDLKVRFSIFSNETKYLCNVVEDYSNIIMIGVLCYYVVFVKINNKIRNIFLFLFIINALDLVFIGLMANYLYLLKLPITAVIYSRCRCRQSNQFLTL